MTVFSLKFVTLGLWLCLKHATIKIRGLLTFCKTHILWTTYLKPFPTPLVHLLQQGRTGVVLKAQCFL